MDTAAFDYDLPEHAIAQHPARPRDSSRLLVARNRSATDLGHSFTSDLPELIEPGDVVVVNDTRVLAARLKLAKPTGGQVECLVLSPVDEAEHDGWWEALVKPSKRVAEGSQLVDHIGLPVLEIGGSGPDGVRYVRTVGVQMSTLLESQGAVPLPPYITARLDDPDRYQTVYSSNPSSVAAPTAGLHFTERVLQRCIAAGAALHRLELSVGLGTFRPVLTDRIDEHPMHHERYHIPESTWQACQQAKRVVAIGTTTVRALESAHLRGELHGSTDLFIKPGFQFGVVNALLTNFHMPRSTLLVMIEAFYGPHWRGLYATALAEGYRFLSFGDAMWLPGQATVT